MHWRTEQSIKDVQDAINELRDRGDRPTRLAIAGLTGISDSYVNRLVQKYTQYLGQPGDGTVSIVADIKPSMVNPGYITKAKRTPEAINPQPQETINTNTEILLRISEALENINRTISTNQQTRLATKANDRHGLSDTQYKVLVKSTQWDKVDIVREELFAKGGIIGLYQLELNIRRYLSKHETELVQSIQTSLDKLNAQANK